MRRPLLLAGLAAAIVALVAVGFVVGRTAAPTRVGAMAQPSLAAARAAVPLHLGNAGAAALPPLRPLVRKAKKPAHHTAARPASTPAPTTHTTAPPSKTRPVTPGITIVGG